MRVTFSLFKSEQGYGKTFIEEKIVKKSRTYLEQLELNQTMLGLWAAGGWSGAKRATRL